MIRKHNKCNGCIDTRPCPYNATLSADGWAVCRIHLNKMHVFTKKNECPKYSWTELGKNPFLNMYGSCQICSKASKVVFFSCGDHRCCLDCASTIEEDGIKNCPICMSLKDY